MCRIILFPDGKTIRSLDEYNPEGPCLCVNTDEEIMVFIIRKIFANKGIENLQDGQRLVIEQNPFAWEVRIEAIQNVTQNDEQGGEKGVSIQM